MRKQKRKSSDRRVDAADVASATECTGLMPALPRNDGEDAASAELYDVHKAPAPRKK